MSRMNWRKNESPDAASDDEQLSENAAASDASVLIKPDELEKLDCPVPQLIVKTVKRQKRSQCPVKVN